MDGKISQEEQELRAQVEQARDRLQALEDELRDVDAEVESLGPQRMHHELLDQACGSLEKLGELGAAELFWGEEAGTARITERLRQVRSRVSAFQEQLVEIDRRRQDVLARIGTENEGLELLGEDLYDLKQQEERRKQEWIVERDESPLPLRAQIMAWARGGDDDRRFYRSLAASLLISVLFGALLPMIPLPLPERFQPEDMPKRIAQLVREEQTRLLKPPAPAPEAPPEPKKPEPEKKPEPKPVEKPEPQAVASAEPEQAEPMPSVASDPTAPAVPSTAVAQAPPQETVKTAGILAFKDKFASLAEDDVSPRLGADARYGDADDVSKAAMPTRSMLTTNAPGSSGGINIGSLSRNVGGAGGGGGGGGGLHGVEVGRATSSISSIGGGDRPLAGGGGGGPGLGRTDEEIQIVFDRYKASFYRLYNRELRNDPTLRGQIVIRLTIEPDGSVSMCALESSDMDAPSLASQVVERVLTINFGEKEGVQALTIVYPIDFLPAA